MKRKDEIGDMATSIEEMQVDLNALIKNILDSSQNLSSLSEELSSSVEESAVRLETINSSTAEISGGVQDTSSSAEEITASMEEVNASILQPSGKAIEEGKVVDKIKIMADAVASIASQTNLLALNATVEQVSQAVQIMAGTSQKVSENTNEIETSIGDSSQGIEQVAKTAQEQAELAQKLNEKVMEFKIK